MAGWDQSRRDRKKSDRTAPQSPAEIPPTTSTRWW